MVVFFLYVLVTVLIGPPWMTVLIVVGLVVALWLIYKPTGRKE